jgi:hypothetical protein
MTSSNKMTAINNLSVNNKHKIHGEATSSTLVEELASHVQRKHKQLKRKHSIKIK